MKAFAHCKPKWGSVKLKGVWDMDDCY